jgi:hypothetical protein
MGNEMMSTQSSEDELSALRKLEQAVRACGLPTMMVSGQVQLDMLSEALKAVAAARAANNTVGIRLTDTAQFASAA